MIEKPPTNKDVGLSKEDIDAAMKERGMIGPETVATQKAELADLIASHARELSELAESMPFTGLDPVVYEDLKREEVEFPDYVVTPIDELIARFRAEGMKVVLDRDGSGLNATVVPWGSTDYDSDSVFFRHLQVYGMVDIRLKELITAMKEHKKLSSDYL